VPAHPDEEACVAAVVGGPPVLRGVDDLEDVALERLDVELVELLGVDEVLTEGVALLVLPVQDRHVDLLGPPVLVLAGSVRLRLRRIDRRVLALTVTGRLRLVVRRAGVGCIR
jgi:hypothetical protein